MDESNQMSQTTIQYQQQIASYIGKLMRDHFGKGPESVNVSIGGPFITAHLRNFITPSEKVLLEQGHEAIVHQIREKLIHMIIPEITRYIETVTGLQPMEFYYDWGLDNKSGMFVGILPDSIEGQTVQSSFYGKQELEAEIVKISQEVQKKPDEVSSYEINSKTIVVIRSGILVRIEKELIRLGHETLLKGVKRLLEKGYLSNNIRIEALLNKHVMDTFVDWDFDRDKSVVLFILRPNA